MQSLGLKVQVQSFWCLELVLCVIVNEYANGMLSWVAQSVQISHWSAICVQGRAGAHIYRNSRSSSKRCLPSSPPQLVSNSTPRITPLD